MRNLIYVLAFIPYAIGRSLTAPAGVLRYECKNAKGKVMKIPIEDTKTSAQYTCDIENHKNTRATGFPKEFIPSYAQTMDVEKQSSKFYINPITSDPNVFTVIDGDCTLAAVVMAMSRSPPRPKSATPPRGFPWFNNSIGTRLGSLVPQSFRTGRPASGQSASNIGNLQNGAVMGSNFIQCRPKTYDWDSDVSGTGRKLGRIPVPGTKVHL